MTTAPTRRCAITLTASETVAAASTVTSSLDAFCASTSSTDCRIVVSRGQNPKSSSITFSRSTPRSRHILITALFITSGPHR
jgi:hypothetical protein